LNHTTAPTPAPAVNDNVEGVPAWGLRYIGDRPREKPSYLIKGILPVKGVGLLAGQSRAGKTFIGLDIVLSIIYGREFLGRKVKPGAVLWFAPEGAGEIEDRVFAARRERFDDGSDSPLPLIWGDNIEGATVDEVCREIEAKVETVKGECGIDDGMWPDHPLRIVVVDTLIAGFPIEDENNNAECGRLMKLLAAIGNRTDVLILVVTHFGKAAGTGVRGASALTAGADVILTCSAVIDDTTGIVAGNRSLALTKSRRGGTGPLVQFKIASTIIDYDEDRDPVTAGYVEFVSGDAASEGKSKPPTLDERIFLAALDEVITSQGIEHRVRGDGPVVRAAPRDAVRREFSRRYVEDGTGKAASTERNAWSRAHKRLQEAGTVSGETFNKSAVLIWRV
jgi:hypothetical protein